MESGTDKPDIISSGNKALDKFAEMMISRMETLRDQPWQKEWITPGTFAGMPRNLSGRSYNGGNSFFLLLDSTMKGYKTPVYLTFNQVKAQDASVLKGEKAFPVTYWDITIKDKNGKSIKLEDFEKLSKEEQKECNVRSFLKSYNVFNIDQTNFREVHPDKYEALCKGFGKRDLRDEHGMYVNQEIDRMISKQEWICPINAKEISKNAYYSPAENVVVVPKKSQFNTGDTPERVYENGMSFYSTLLHEMTHSTVPVLKREVGKVFGDPKYAKEELVAELSSSLVGSSLGFSSKITDNSAAYLNAWISTLRKEPKFLLSVMSDVNKASKFIMEKIDIQRMKLGNDPLLVTSSKQTGLSMDDPLMYKGSYIYRDKYDQHSLKGFFNGKPLGTRPLPLDRGRMFESLKDTHEKDVFLMMEVKKHFSAGINKIIAESNKNQSIEAESRPKLTR
ncbi:MAG: ArdC family protein [Bacteroides sp.]|nr:ArdC family protein [Bacteroides sp.]